MEYNIHVYFDKLEITVLPIYDVEKKSCFYYDAMNRIVLNDKIRISPKLFEIYGKDLFEIHYELIKILIPLIDNKHCLNNTSELSFIIARRPINMLFGKFGENILCSEVYPILYKYPFSDLENKFEDFPPALTKETLFINPQDTFKNFPKILTKEIIQQFETNAMIKDIIE
jgi:hypothetical protein